MDNKTIISIIKSNFSSKIKKFNYKSNIKNIKFLKGKFYNKDLLTKNINVNKNRRNNSIDNVINKNMFDKIDYFIKNFKQDDNNWEKYVKSTHFNKNNINLKKKKKLIKISNNSLDRDNYKNIKKFLKNKKFSISNKKKISIKNIITNCNNVIDFTKNKNKSKIKFKKEKDFCLNNLVLKNKDRIQTFLQKKKKIKSIY